jgi:hypothetical protein
VGLARSQLWQKVERGLGVLKSNNYLSAYKIDKNNTVHVWYVKQPKAENNELEKSKSGPKASADDPNPIITKYICSRLSFSDPTDKARLIPGVQTLVDYQKLINLRTAAMERMFNTPLALCKTYIKWMEYQDWIEQIVIGHVRADGKMFKKFVKEMEEECNGYKLVTKLNHKL